MSKIQFDIKFRPQIESGEYKVETQNGCIARIICWDRKDNNYPIVALFEEGKSGKECLLSYTQNGQHVKGISNGSDLVIITPEPELTEFEKELESFYNHHLQVCTYDNQGTVEDSLHDGASKLLAIARKELCNRCSTGLNEYWRGRKEAMEEASRGYHYEGPMTPVFWPPCIYSGECTNPFRDCINCPRQSTIGINTTTGTSTAKVEG